MPVSHIYYSEHVEHITAALTEGLAREGIDTRWWRLGAAHASTPSLILVAKQDLDTCVGPARAVDVPVIAVLDQWDPQTALECFDAGCCAAIPAEPLPVLMAQTRTLLGQRSTRHETGASDSESNMLHVVLDAVPVPIFYKDEQHIYRGCNLAFTEYLGKSREEIIGSSVYDIAPKELADVYFEADERLLASAGVQRYEAKVRYSDGSYRDIEFHKAVFFKADGKPGGQVGAMLDVTERNRLTSKLAAFSTTDPLTGAGNRRQFKEVSARAVQQHRRTGRPLSLLVLDVDHFKQFNDTYGHQVGDQVLIHLVKCCEKMLREEDQLFRVGGEEFYLILPETELDDARRLAERLRSGLNRMPVVVDGKTLPYSVSLGVAQIEPEEPVDQCLRRADKALYRAKREGRNRVCC